MRCQFEEVGQSLYRCRACGLQIRTARPVDPGAILSACGEGRPEVIPQPQPQPQPEVQFRQDLVRASLIGVLQANGAQSDEVIARAEKCLACPEFSGTCCRRIEGPCEAKFGQWVDVIIAGSCELFGGGNHDEHVG